MNTIKSIFVIVEPDKKEQPALARAAEFCKGSPAQVTLFCCLHYPAIESTYVLDPANMERVKQAMIQHHKNKLLTLIRDHKHEHLDIKMEVVWKDAVHLAMLESIEQHKPDLVIKCNHKHSSLSQWFFNSIDRQLMRACPAPLLFIKRDVLEAHSSVVASIDPSHRLNQHGELDKQVLRNALAVAQQLDSPLHACHCFNPSYWEILLKAIGVAEIWTDVFPANPDADNHRVIDELRIEHNEKFKKVCEEFVPASENQHLLEGALDMVIPDLLAKLNTGILVLGATHRTGLLGSTAENMLEFVHCDVLIVKPVDFQTPFTL